MRIMSSSNRKHSPGLSRSDEKERSKSIARESFKCTAPCLYFPGFSKRRTMVHLPSEKSRAEEMPEELNTELQPDSTAICATDDVSREFSFDRLTRSSCNSGIIFNLMVDKEGCKSPFYDLPMELIRGRNIDDAKSPVNAAFVFSCDPKKTMETRRVLLLAQSKSLQLNSKSHDPEFGRALFSCPTSPKEW